MPIQILPARLANQIAAGEVVERPASVVKELLENSLDAQANSIEIEIDKGGHKRILIRDNGKGIPKQELALALSRHATSKISKLDDLEAICSLGFRGEALASISSVSRLALNSKPSEQTQAWQASCEGRDMEVKVNPIAHPNGSSVEVLDLFFNTPARRKFLRTEKTEFSHIDELLRRIALSRFDVSFSLKHNNKLLRKYPAVTQQSNQLKRIAAICGQDFAQNCIELNSSYQEFELKGWMTQPNANKAAAECQYFYVNGRMMRDKLINHAIRQAFEENMGKSIALDYVLYLNLPPDQVDVNVHPAKHEVRFHKARLVHDFIFRALTDAMQQFFAEGNHTAINQQLPEAAPKHDYIQPLQYVSDKPQLAEHSHSYSQTPSGASVSAQDLGKKAHAHHALSSAPIARQSSENYQQLMTPNASAFNQEQQSPVESEPTSLGVGQWLKVNNEQLIAQVEQQFYLISIQALHLAKLKAQFDVALPVSQPLLMPISIAAEPALLSQAKDLYQGLLENSVEIGWTLTRLMIRKVPAGFRQLNWAECFTDILQCPKTDSLTVRKHLLACMVASMQVDNQQIQMWLNQDKELGKLLASIGRPVALSEWIANYD
ncbi:DNA mismatch repair endonuclease MutL [Paraglaciecola aestuariivivens]